MRLVSDASRLKALLINFAPHNPVCLLLAAAVLRQPAADLLRPVHYRHLQHLETRHRNNNRRNNKCRAVKLRVKDKDKTQHYAPLTILAHHTKRNAG